MNLVTKLEQNKDDICYLMGIGVVSFVFAFGLSYIIFYIIL
jgi:hypothetical protein